MSFRVGDKVEVISNKDLGSGCTSGCHRLRIGYRGKIVSIGSNIVDSDKHTYGIDNTGWYCTSKEIKLLKKVKVAKKKVQPKPKLDDALAKSIADSVKAIKKSGYKGTAIKIELEAQLNRDGWDDDDCHDFILEAISEEAKDKLVYSDFFVDGSVDSEMTFTYMLDDLKYAVEVIKAFKDLADEIGQGLDVDGAGMHVAILNSKDGDYPAGNKLVASKFDNMRSTVGHLMPALFFLASSDWKSRGLGYRLPRCERSKYSAINAGTGALEFRVFETCYDKPEMIYDFVCVIANCLEFYKSKKVEFPFFGKIGEIGMGEQGKGLGRFFTTVRSLDALDAGLEILKPAHKSIEQLKKERNFSVTREKLVKKEHKLEARWRDEYRYQYADKPRANKTYEEERKRYMEYYRREARAVGETPSQYLGVSLGKYVDEALRDNGINKEVESEPEYIEKKRKELFVKPSDSLVVV